VSAGLTNGWYARYPRRDSPSCDLDPIRKGFRMGVFSVRCSVFRRGSGREVLLSWHFRGQRFLIGLS